MPNQELKAESLALFNNKKYEKALEWCRKAAYKGHQKAKDIIYRLQQDGQITF